MKNRSWIRHLGFISERGNIDNIESRDSIERCLYWRLQMKTTRTKKDNIPTLSQAQDSNANSDQIQLDLARLVFESLIRQFSN